MSSWVTLTMVKFAIVATTMWFPYATVKGGLLVSRRNIRIRNVSTSRFERHFKNFVL